MLQEKAAPLPLDLPPPAAAQLTATSSGTRSTKTTRATQALLLLLLFVGYELVLSPALVRIGGTSASASSTGAAAAVAHKDGRQPPAWAPCPGFEADPRFTCATQEVPLDHAKGLHGGVATIALSRYSVPGSSLEGRKTLFVNPGGPGGSGHAYTFRAAPSFSRVVEDEYDIIGFDPRGVVRPLSCSSLLILRADSPLVVLSPCRTRRCRAWPASTACARSASSSRRSRRPSTRSTSAPRPT